MTSHVSNLAPVATAAPPRKLSLKMRLMRLRKRKLWLEKRHHKRSQLIRRLRELLKKLQTKKKEESHEAKSLLHDRDCYINNLENEIKRHEHYLKKCMARCPKKGDRYPVTPCTDCGKRYPITHFKLRVAMGTARHWTIVPNCRKCLHERNKRIDEKRREANAALRTPVNNNKHAREMATQIMNGVHSGV